MRDINVCVCVCECMNIYVLTITRAYIHILNYTYIYEKSTRKHSAPRFTSLLLILLLFASDGEREEREFWIVFDLPLESCNFSLM